MIETENKSISDFPTIEGTGGLQTDNDSINDLKTLKPEWFQKGFKIGDVIMSRYRVLEILGQGGMGIVYKCFDETAGVEVALKTLPPELSHNTIEMENIKDNFQLVSKLVHQNLAVSKNLERDTANGDYYLIMEACEGENLNHWIKQKRKNGGLTVQDILPIIKQIADALDYAHERKVIHRDIKPGNVMIDKKGNVKVLDFGLAAQIHSSMTRVSMIHHGISGTGPYMSPEQWRGRTQGAAADQYALAVMTYEMLAGKLPFESLDPVILKQAVLDDFPEEIPGVSGSVQAAVMRAMSKKPEDRFKSCSEFAAAIEGKNNKYRFLKWIAVIITVELLGIGTGYYFFHNQQTSIAQKVSEVPAQKVSVPPEPPAVPAQKVSVPPEPPAVPVQKVSVPPEPPAVPAKKVSSEVKVSPQVEAEKLRKQKFIQENFHLYSVVKNKKKKIDSAQYDRGQTFGEYLDALDNNFAAAGFAWNINEPDKKDPESANKFYKEADKAADWILQNAPLRLSVQSLQKKVDSARNQAVQMNAGEKSKVEYEKAETNRSLGWQYYTSGNFSSATSALNIALAEYQKAYTNAYRITLNEYTRSVEEAVNKKMWDQVKAFAEKIRPLNKEKADELVSYADRMKKLEKIASLLNEAKAAKARNEWLTVYKKSGAVLEVDDSNQEAAALRNESEKYCMNERCVELFYAGNYKEAWNLLLKIRKRSARTELILGVFFRRGFDVCMIDLKKSFYHTEKAAEMGDAAAKTDLGICMYRGDGCPKNIDKAKKMLLENYDSLLSSAKSGDPAAQNTLAVLYGSGYLEPENHTEALKWYKKAVEQKFLIAQANLGAVHFLGLGVPRNADEAIKFLQKSADLEDVYAQFMIGLCYRQKDYKSSAINWFHKAAKQGAADAQGFLSEYYYYDNDYYEAVKWARKSAEQGNYMGQLILGLCYYNGNGVRRNYSTASDWFEKSAEQGYAEAQYWFGFCYEFGNGVWKSRSKALKWYEKAAAQGHRLAEDGVRRIIYDNVLP